CSLAPRRFARSFRGRTPRSSQSRRPQRQRFFRIHPRRQRDRLGWKRLPSTGRLTMECLMKTKEIAAILMLILALCWVSRVYAAVGFESVRCGSDVRKALMGRKTSNEPVVVLEARHKDLQLKDLGAEEISDRLNLIFWRICGEEYAVLEVGDFVRDVLKF